MTRDAVAVGEPTQPAVRELMLYCHGFCEALSGHHIGEDTLLFPAIAAAHPDLRDTLRYLEQDHSMIAHLLQGLQAVVDSGGTPADLDRHLEGIEAIMESHFRYEERQLLSVLETLDLASTASEVFGPL